MSYYLFPFEKVPKGSRVVLYGAGVVGQAFYLQATGITGIAGQAFYCQVMETGYCEIVLWLDKNADGEFSKKPEAIRNLSVDDYDIVIIAIQNKLIADDVKKSLIDYGVPKNKILHKISIGDLEYTESPFCFESGYFERKGMEIFEKFPNWQQAYKSLSGSWQIAFLLGLISNYQFKNGEKIKNVLEIGVFNGVTSLYMLKVGLLAAPDFKLYAIDICKSTFFGEAVFAEANTNEQSHYHLYRGSTSFDIEKVIPENTKLDMVFIDGAHTHPHPLLDLIHCIPFLRVGAIVMLHDVVDYMRPNAWGESFIYTGWTDKKYQTVRMRDEVFEKTTLGCIKIPDEKQCLYENIRRIAKISFKSSPWKFENNNMLGIDESSLQRLLQFMVKYYDKVFAEEIYETLRRNLNEYEQNCILYNHETKFYNYLFNSNISLQNKIVDLQKEILNMSERIKMLEKHNTGGY